MSHPEPQELIQAEKLIEEGKPEEALHLLNTFVNKKDLSYCERILYYRLRSQIAFYYLDNEECTKYAEKAYQEGHKLENSLLLLDVYIMMANSLLFSFKANEALKFIKKSEDLLNKLPHEPSIKLKKRKAFILWNKGVNHQLKGEFERAKEFREEALILLKELDLKLDFAIMLCQLGGVAWHIGDLNRALEYTEKSETLLAKLNLPYSLHYCYKQFGAIYAMKGELDRALSYYERVLAFAEKENVVRLKIGTYNNIAIIYQEKGDYDLALEHMKKSMNITEEYMQVNKVIFDITDSLFHLALDMNDLEQAQLYLNRMKQLENKEKDQTDLFKIRYSINKAIYLKNTPRAFNRGKAEEVLKHLIEEGIPEYEFLKLALLNLCELFLFELYDTNELEILEELNVYISQLFNTAKNSHSYSLLAETYLLKARLSLITLDLMKVRFFLTKAQEIAEKYGLNRLAFKISSEHDELLKNLDKWENMKKSDNSIIKRLKLAKLNEQMERMVRNREIHVPELSDEEPILLLIVSEGGRPVFSQKFAEDQSFEDYLFGGFLSAINAFTNEMFSEGLDRASFGEHTLLMNSVSPFFICYIFKGQSYSAQHRLLYFLDKLQNEKDIWQTFEKYYQRNQEIKLKDIPFLEPLITEIFIEKEITIF
ncbi:MAG: tetratricopeptide repeat protein [Candidatus Thorarchaeota archaeon]